MAMKEYKVIIYREGLLGSMFLGESKVNPRRLTDFINDHAQEGWRVVAVERENRRTLLFFNREAFLIFMERDA